MADINEDTLYNMSDEELDAAFAAAKSEDVSPNVGEEFNAVENTVEDEEEFEVEVEENNEADELEQPEDQDSDDDASSENEEEDESEEETEESKDDDLDGDSEEEEDDTTEEKEESKEEEQPVQNYKFKANGRDYEFTDAEIKEQFPKIFGQAMDYTKKMQAIKPWRKTIDAIEGAELNHNDVNLMIDVLKGDKGAISEVIKRTGVDTLELDTEENKYTPKDYGRDATALELKDVIDTISADPEYVTTQKILGKDWDEGSWEEVSKDPELVKLLHKDVKSGVYDKVQPIADMLKIRNPSKKDLDLYIEAGGIYFQRLDQEKAKQAEAAKAEAEREAKKAEEARLAEVKAKQEKARTVKQESKKRKAAAPTKRSAGTKKHTNYLDDSDEAFEEWYQKLQDNQ